MAYAYILFECVNFVDFGYDWYVMFSLLEFLHEKISITYQSNAESTKKDALKNTIICHIPSYNW